MSRYCILPLIVLLRVVLLRNTSVMALKKVMKLAAIGIKAVRVCRQNTGHFASVVSGEFSFGRSHL